MTADARFILLARIAAILCPDYPMKWPQLDWIHSPEFRTYLDRFGESNSFNTERRWTLMQLTRMAQGVPGDTAECGAFQGAGSYLICMANERTRMHHVFDSFEGLSAPGVNDGGYWSAGGFATPEAVVIENLRDFDGHYQLHKGWIPAKFPSVAGNQFAFVHIDVDLYQPTADSIAFFYPRMPPGAVLVCDDYGSATCPGASNAIDEFLADKPEKMIELPCGSGFMIKGVETAGQLGSTQRGQPEMKPSYGTIAFNLAKLLLALPLFTARRVLRSFVPGRGP